MRSTLLTRVRELLAAADVAAKNNDGEQEYVNLERARTLAVVSIAESLQVLASSQEREQQRRRV